MNQRHNNFDFFSYTVKPGTCPVQYTVCRAAFDVCEKDEECPGIKRCCEGNCGTVCRTPEKGTSWA
uniref:WAP domain-containing protein n=1 Tax=Pseudonaja textilis TaxID=8673 RepID=A0A670YPS6_PSETE